MTHYQTLGIAQDATADEIKKAFHRLALATHPDHHPGDSVKEEQFKAISAAYEILGDQTQRKRYDMELLKQTWQKQRAAAEEAQASAPPPPPSPTASTPTASKEDNFWGVLFGLGIAAFAWHKMSQASNTTWDPNVERNRGPDGRFRPS
ncbi:J domain-containing protein [Archangium primigenium]|uniref:J domain-containing protein n=1 Tax=[Archangium] primigenium TaxID=2792470 RepID=UPI00195BD3FB|nr:J domain-containing protein [Archangium primigenium]MBM7112466.1 J domain-containing protein [Archangium primigenium]